MLSRSTELERESCPTDRNASSRCPRHAACHAALSSLATRYHKPKVIHDESRADVILGLIDESRETFREYILLNFFFSFLLNEHLNDISTYISNA